MEAWLQASVHWLLLTLALPRVGLSAIFLVSLLSATLLPLGSEPAVFGYIKLAPDMFWPAVLLATLGNTAGGGIRYAMGLGAEKAYDRWREKHPYKARSKKGRSEESRVGKECGRTCRSRGHTDTYKKKIKPNINK